jgi:hypothetical protein
MPGQKVNLWAGPGRENSAWGAWLGHHNHEVRSHLERRKYDWPPGHRNNPG